jgi:hypothetical protein
MALHKTIHGAGGHVLTYESDIRPIYSNPECPMACIEDEAYLVGHFCHGEWYTLDGQLISKKSAARIIRRWIMKQRHPRKLGAQRLG